MVEANRCAYTKPDRTPCRAFAGGRSRLCYWHSRQAARDRRRTRALNRGRTVRLGPLHTHAATMNALSRVLQLLAAGTLPPDRAGRALVRINEALAELNLRSDGKTMAMKSDTLDPGHVPNPLQLFLVDL